MPTASELFSQAIKANGLGTRLPDDATVRANPLFQLHKALAEVQIEGFRLFWDPTGRFPTQAPILIDYIDSPFAGAWAFTFNGQYIISINYGIILILEFMFNALLSSRDVLLDVGNPLAEADNLPVIPITTNYDDIVAGILIHGLTLSDFIPRDKQRRDVADFLTFTAIRFLMGHEFRHIQAGHTDYYANGFKIGYVSEYVSKGVPVDIAMKRQALEWDADSFSVVRVLEHHWRTRANALQKPQRYADFYQDNGRLFFLCMTACASFFRLLDGETPPRSDWNTFSHPPSRNRRLILVNTGLIWAEDTYPQDFNETAKTEIIQDCVHIIEILTSRLWACHYDRAYSLLVYTHALAHELEIMDVGRSIIGDLAKYSYVPLSPPSPPPR